MAAKRTCRAAGKRIVVGLCALAVSAISAAGIALGVAYLHGNEQSGGDMNDFGVVTLDNETQELAGEGVQNMYDLMINSSHGLATKGANRRLSPTRNSSAPSITVKGKFKLQTDASKNVTLEDAHVMLQMEQVMEPSDGNYVLASDPDAIIEVPIVDAMTSTEQRHVCSRRKCELVKQVGGRRLFWKLTPKTVCDMICSTVMIEKCETIPARYQDLKSIIGESFNEVLCNQALSELLDQKMSELRRLNQIPERAATVTTMNNTGTKAATTGTTATTTGTTATTIGTTVTNNAKTATAFGSTMITTGTTGTNRDTTATIAGTKATPTIATTVTTTNTIARLMEHIERRSQLEMRFGQAMSVCSSMVKYASDGSVKRESAAALRETLIDMFKQANFLPEIERTLISTTEAIPDTAEFFKTQRELVAAAHKICNKRPSKTCKNVCWVVRIMTWVARRFACLPADAPMLTQTGLMPVAAVGLTTPILTSSGFTKSYMDPHMDFYAVTQMQYLKAATGHELYLSSQHYIKADGGYMFAEDVRVGMEVEIVFENASKYLAHVVDRGVVLKRGLFSPFNAAGDYAIGTRGLEGGIVVSVFSEFFLEGLLPPEIIPAIYGKLFAPVALIHRYFPAWLERFNKDMWQKSSAAATEGKPVPAFNELGVIEITKSACSSMWAKYV